MCVCADLLPRNPFFPAGVSIPSSHPQPGAPRRVPAFLLMPWGSILGPGLPRPHPQSLKGAGTEGRLGAQGDVSVLAAAGQAPLSRHILPSGSHRPGREVRGAETKGTPRCRALAGCQHPHSRPHLSSADASGVKKRRILQLTRRKGPPAPSWGGAGTRDTLTFIDSDHLLNTDMCGVFPVLASFLPTEGDTVQRRRRKQASAVSGRGHIE